mgnify:CR=1 FL=1
MPVTQQDLQDFAQFADAKLANGGAESMSELAAAWESARQLDDSIERLQQSDADIEAGRTKPAKEVFADVKQRLSARS